jgi:hypothetical protein
MDWQGRPRRTNKCCAPQGADQFTHPLIAHLFVQNPPSLDLPLARPGPLALRASHTYLYLPLYRNGGHEGEFFDSIGQVGVE